MAPNDEPASDERPDAEAPRGKQTYFGRQGSPEITVAFPFSKVEIARTDETLRTALVATLRLLDALAERVAALASAPNKEARAEVSAAVEHLRADLDALATTLAASPDA